MTQGAHQAAGRHTQHQQQSSQGPHSIPPPEATVVGELKADALPAAFKHVGRDVTFLVNPDYFGVVKAEDGSYAACEQRNPLGIKLVHTFELGSVVCAVAFSPDGRYFATGGNRSTSVFHLATGSRFAEFRTPGGPDDCYVRALAFHPQGQDLLASAGENGIISVWSMSAAREAPPKLVCAGHEQDVYCIRWIPGRIISGSGDGCVFVYSDSTGAVLRILRLESSAGGGGGAEGEGPGRETCGITSLDVSGDHKLLVTGSLDSLIRIWALDTGTLLHTMAGHEKPVYSVAFGSMLPRAS